MAWISFHASVFLYILAISGLQWKALGSTGAFFLASHRSFCLRVLSVHWLTQACSVCCFFTALRFALLVATMSNSLGCRIWEVQVCKVSCQFVFFEAMAWDTSVCGSTEKTLQRDSIAEPPQVRNTLLRFLAVLLNRILEINWQWHFMSPHLACTSGWISCWRTSLTFFLSSSFP